MANFNAEFPSGFQEQLTDLKSDSSLKLSFGELSLPKFWCQVPNENPILYKEALKTTIPFPNLCLCEMKFSIPAFMKDKYRNRLNVEPRLRLALRVMSYDLKNLLKQNTVERC